MNVELRQPVHPAKSRLEIVDVDIHPRNALEDLRPHLSNRWWDYLQTYGRRPRHGYVAGYPYPKMTPSASRRDAWPPSGGQPGSDLGFMQEQHLDPYGIAHGILNPLQPSGQGAVSRGSRLRSSSPMRTPRPRARKSFAAPATAASPR